MIFGKSLYEKNTKYKIQKSILCIFQEGRFETEGFHDERDGARVEP
jgi:hypothetical protein